MVLELIFSNCRKSFWKLPFLFYFESTKIIRGTWVQRVHNLIEFIRHQIKVMIGENSRHFRIVLYFLFFFMKFSEEGERQSNSQSAIHKTKKRDTYVENTVQMLWTPHR
jgi:F0F1-type ATP synthase membrane subunit a